MCQKLYDGPCAKRACDCYHPEVKVLPQPIINPLSPTQDNRDRMICIMALKSQCNRQDCNRFHFRLPSVRVLLLFSVDFSQLPCREKKSPLSNESRNLPHPPQANLSPPHRLRTCQVSPLPSPNALHGTMDIVPTAGTVKCSTLPQ